MSRFMDATTDFGFKKLFCDEANKDLTISFLNDLLALESPLLDLELSNSEQLPNAHERRSGIYDLFCRDAEGNQFLVEMQKSRLAFIKDRMVYYSTFPVAAQARKGGRRGPSSSLIRKGRGIRDGIAPSYSAEQEEAEATAWNYELKAIYCIAILGYALAGSTTAVNRNSLRNDQPPHEIFYDKLKFVTVELPLFDERKPEYHLDHHLHQWLYFLKYLPTFERIPDVYKHDNVFQKAFWVAELANFTTEERRLYEVSLKHLWDTFAVLETSYTTGMAQGVLEGRIAGRIAGQIEGKIEGKREGQIEEGREMLRLIFTQKLGPIPNDIAIQIVALDDPQRIHQIATELMTVNNWDDFRLELASTKR